MVQRSAYVFYGCRMMAAYVVFPMTLAFAPWPGQFGRFAAHLMLLLSLKMWSAFWAMLAIANEGILPIVIASGAIDGPTSTRCPALPQFITALTVVSVPALVSMLFGVASHRIGANLSRLGARADPVAVIADHGPSVMNSSLDDCEAY